jgi:GxxExxY protein
VDHEEQTFGGHGWTRMDTKRTTAVGEALTEGVIGAAFEVANVLGPGFLEKVYERAFLRELTLRGLKARSQVCFPVCYKGQCDGEYVADQLVENELIVELKCADRLSDEHLAQCINYLKA